METPINIGGNISKNRLAHGYSIDKLANYLGVQCDQLTDYENGIGNLSVTNLNKLADLFGLELDELLAGCTSSITPIPHNKILADIDIMSIAEFNRIVLNYIKMNRLIGSL